MVCLSRLSLGSSTHFLALHLLYDHFPFPFVTKICQDDLGTYILKLYGTDEYHLSWLGVRCHFRQSGLVTGMYVEHCFVGKGFLQATSLSLKGIIAMWRHTSSTRSTQTLILPVPLGLGYKVPPYHTPPHCIGQKGNGHVWRSSGYLASPWASLSLCGTVAYLWVSAFPHKTITSDTIRSAILVVEFYDVYNIS